MKLVLKFFAFIEDDIRLECEFLVTRVDKVHLGPHLRYSHFRITPSFSLLQKLAMLFQQQLSFFSLFGEHLRRLLLVDYFLIHGRLALFTSTDERPQFQIHLVGNLASLSVRFIYLGPNFCYLLQFLFKNGIFFYTGFFKFFGQQSSFDGNLQNIGHKLGKFLK